VENKVRIHDLHATIPHPGFDHEKLTSPNEGRDFRMIDAKGRAAKGMLG